MKKTILTQSLKGTDDSLTIFKSGSEALKIRSPAVISFKIKTPLLALAMFEAFTISSTLHSTLRGI
jgi:hypothetical protein